MHNFAELRAFYRFMRRVLAPVRGAPSPRIVVILRERTRARLAP